MPPQPIDFTSKRLTTFAYGTGWALVVLGVLVLLGWALDIEILKRVFPQLVAMNPASAVALSLSGAALCYSRRTESNENRANTKARIAKACAGGAVFIGAVKLIGLWYGASGGIDQFLFREALRGPPGSIPSEMAPNSAIISVLVGVALLLLDTRTKSGRKPAEFFAVAAALLSWLAVMGYVYNAPSLYRMTIHIPMALHTAISFLLLSFAILCARPTGGLMGIIMSQSAGGQTARGILPAIFLVESALGWFRIIGERKGYFSPETGVSFMVVFGIALCSVVIMWSSASLEKVDVKRREAEKSLEAANAQLEDRVQQRTTELTLSNAELKNEISARQKSQQALAAAEANFRTLVEQSLVGIYVIQDGKFAYVNPQMAEIFGYSAEELCSRPGSYFTDPADHPTVNRYANQLLNREVPNIRYQLRMIRRDGSRVDVEAHGATAEFKGRTAILGTLLDITERKLAEDVVRQLNLALEQRVVERTTQLEIANKELEAFSYSVSHDLRAPLRHVAGFVDLLSNELGESVSPKSRRFVKIIADSAKQMGQLIDELLVFSKMSRVELQETFVDTNQVVAETIAALKPDTEGRNIVWKKSELPKVKADPVLLRQVFVNLLSNAIKYSGPSNPAEIEIGHEEKDNETVIFVRDNGVGFDMKFADKLFGVFQRLHHADEFEGTGVGLANVRRIIQRHGGRTWAESTLGGGATFSFSLPKTNNDT